MEQHSENNINRPDPIEVSKRISKIAANIDKQSWGLKSGLTELDEALLGFHGGELIVIAGRPSIGKTSLSTGIANGISESAKTLYFSLELSSKVIQERLLCQQAELNYYDIKRNGIGNNEVNLSKATKVIESRHLYIDDAPSLNPIEFQQIIEKNNIECAIVDYVQLASSGAWSENRVKEIDVICRELRATAKIFDIPIILLAQLNRQVEQRKEHRPLLCDLRDSGSIEQLAQIVILIHRPSFYEERELGISTEDTWDAELIIAKNYNGPTGVVNVGFIPHSMKFVSKGAFA
jgi:replicative DNA helicase